jgi:hypothetical protein
MLVLQIPQEFLPQSLQEAQRDAICSEGQQNDLVAPVPTRDAVLEVLPPLSDANLQSLASTLTGLMAAGQIPGPEYLASAAGRFQQLLGEQFDDCAVATILEALAMFGYNPSPCQVDAAAAAIGANLQVWPSSEEGR